MAYLILGKIPKELEVHQEVNSLYTCTCISKTPTGGAKTTLIISKRWPGSINDLIQIQFLLNF